VLSASIGGAILEEVKSQEFFYIKRPGKAASSITFSCSFSSALDKKTTVKK
jgi:hypothetical protein